MALALFKIASQMLCHRYLGLRLFAQRHTNGVANAVGQQRAYAHGTFYAAVFALASLGHAQVQGVVHIGLIHLAHQQSHRLHHHHGVAGFDADYHIVKLLFLADAQKLHAAFNNAFGGVAIARHNAVRERAVVYAYAHGGMVLAADV